MGKHNLPDAVLLAYLAELEARLVAGDNRALFSAIAFCGQQEIAMPEWVVAAYFAAMNRWWSLECRTLDEAFGVAWPKGKQIEKAREQRRLQFAVHADVESARVLGRGISAALFAEVGKRHGISKTVADEYYYAAKRFLESVPKSPDMLLATHMTREDREAHFSRKVSKGSGRRLKRS